MQSPGSAFADTFMRGFSLMDAYYSRQKANKRADARDARQAEANIINMENLGLQNKKLKREDWANQWANITSDDAGNPLQFDTLTPEALKEKKLQTVGFMNGYDPIKKYLLAQNPNRKDVNSIETIRDKQTGKVMIAVNFNMRDGSVKGMT